MRLEHGVIGLYLCLVPDRRSLGQNALILYVFVHGYAAKELQTLLRFLYLAPCYLVKLVCVPGQKVEQGKVLFINGELVCYLRKGGHGVGKPARRVFGRGGLYIVVHNAHGVVVGVHHAVHLFKLCNGFFQFHKNLFLPDNGCFFM